MDPLSEDARRFMLSKEFRRAYAKTYTYAHRQLGKKWRTLKRVVMEAAESDWRRIKGVFGGR